MLNMAKKILLIDDDLFIRELYEEVLEAEGYEVETAADGKVGLDKLTKNNYDLVLLDIMLPQIDGIGIIDKLKTSKTQVPLKSVVLLTNLANDPVVKTALESGVHSCLIKSDITPDQLVAHIQKVLGDKPSQDKKVAQDVAQDDKVESKAESKVEPKAEPTEKKSKDQEETETQPKEAEAQDGVEVVNL